MSSLHKSSPHFKKRSPTCGGRTPPTPSIGARSRRTVSTRTRPSSVFSSGATRSFRSMPKPELRIGILTLSQGDESQLVPGALSAQLQALISQGKIAYAASPDDWIPFDDGKTILSHLQDGLGAFQLFSDSSDVARFKTRRKIQLFVIDPTVLLHPEKAKLAILIQEHICSCNDKASCIVICGALPSQFAADLLAQYRDKLND